MMITSAKLYKDPVEHWLLAGAEIDEVTLELFTTPCWGVAGNLLLPGHASHYVLASVPPQIDLNDRSSAKALIVRDIDCVFHEKQGGKSGAGTLTFNGSEFFLTSGLLTPVVTPKAFQYTVPSFVASTPIPVLSGVLSATAFNVTSANTATPDIGFTNTIPLLGMTLAGGPLPALVVVSGSTNINGPPLVSAFPNITGSIGSFTGTPFLTTFPVVNVTGTYDVPSWNFSADGSFNASSGSWTATFTAAATTVVVCLYIATVDYTTGQWTVRKPGVNANDAQMDYLDLITDVYIPPSGFSDYTGRSWRLRLPREVIIGPGRALVATFNVVPVTGSSSNGSMFFVPYIRSIVDVIAA